MRSSKSKRSSKAPKYLDEFELAEKTDENVNSDEEKHVETSEAGSEEDAKDDGEESFNLNQPIPPAEDGLPPFIKIALWRKNLFKLPSGKERNLYKN